MGIQSFGLYVFKCHIVCLNGRSRHATENEFESSIFSTRPYSSIHVKDTFIQFKDAFSQNEEDIIQNKNDHYSLKRFFDSI